MVGAEVDAPLGDGASGPLVSAVLPSVRRLAAFQQSRLSRALKARM